MVSESDTYFFCIEYALSNEVFQYIPILSFQSLWLLNPCPPVCSSPVLTCAEGPKICECCDLKLGVGNRGHCISQPQGHIVFPPVFFSEVILWKLFKVMWYFIVFFHFFYHFIREILFHVHWENSPNVKLFFRFCMSLLYNIFKS